MQNIKYINIKVYKTINNHINLYIFLKFRFFFLKSIKTLQN